MEGHAKKRLTMQLEKLKSYKKIDRDWKNKVKKIAR